MEEILSSIRRIISDDQRSLGGAPLPPGGGVQGSSSSATASQTRRVEEGARGRPGIDRDLQRLTSVRSRPVEQEPALDARTVTQAREPSAESARHAEARRYADPPARYRTPEPPQEAAYDDRDLDETYYEERQYRERRSPDPRDHSRDERGRQESNRQEAGRQEFARQEMLREPARPDSARIEAGRREPVRPDDRGQQRLRRDSARDDYAREDYVRTERGRSTHPRFDERDDDDSDGFAQDRVEYSGRGFSDRRDDDLAELVSSNVNRSVSNSFGTLASRLSGSRRLVGAEYGLGEQPETAARGMEDFVAEMLKPMLREWLDDNLPGMVEDMVRAEIERLTRGRRG